MPAFRLCFSELDRLAQVTGMREVRVNRDPLPIRATQAFGRLIVTLRALRRELPRAVRLGLDRRSSCMLVRDVLMYRCLRVFPWLSSRRQRRVFVHGGVSIYYRRNRGDLHTLREVWFAEAYRLPFDAEPRTVIDLGANVGLTSLWLSSRYPVEQLVAVEPSSSNVAVLRRNLSGHNANVIHAAVGPGDGSIAFTENAQSHLGRVGGHGGSVRQVSMRTVLDEFPPDVMVDLLKVDIEGSEGQLFSGDLTWLRRVRAIIIEIHPLMVDGGEVVARIRKQGFAYVPAGSVWPASMDAFVREEDDRPPAVAGSN
jgi:FkbM family methyltransferase